MPLTPLIAPLKCAVDDALADLLGQPAARWHLEGETITVDLDRLTLLLRPGETGWVMRGGLAATVRRLPRAQLSDPTVRRLLRSLQGRLPGADGTRLSEALSAWRPFVGAEDRMYRQLVESTGGRLGVIRTGFRCSQRCHFCWQDRGWPDAPEDLLHRWIDELIDAGAQRLTISGGEPTLHRALPDLIAHAADRGLPVHLQTNAIRLAKPRYLQALQQAGLTSVLISLHSADPAISDAMTAAPGTHARTLAGIAVCLRAGLWVALNCCVEAANVDGLAALAALIVDRFVDPDAPGRSVRLVNLSQPSDYFEPGRWAERVVPIPQARPHLLAAARTLYDAGVACQAGGSCGYPLCVFAEDPAVILWPPPDSADAQDLSSRTTLPVCEGCAAKPWCAGVRRAYLDQCGPDGIAPFSADQPLPPPGVLSPA